MICLPLFIMFALGAAAIAHDKGRAAHRWMLAGLCVGPLALAVVLLPGAPPTNPITSPAREFSRSVFPARMRG